MPVEGKCLTFKVVKEQLSPDPAKQLWLLSEPRAGVMWRMVNKHEALSSLPLPLSLNTVLRD